MIRNSIIHSYAGKYPTDKGLDQNPYLVPDGYKLSKNNPFTPTLFTSYQVYYTKDGVYVGNPRGGATMVDEQGNAINPTDYGLELRTVKVRVSPYTRGDIKSFDPLQPMRDNYALYKAGKTETGFVAHEITALENLGLDYYKELEANAIALGAELKGANTVDSIGVLLTTFGSTAGAFGAIVSATGWLVQSLSGKKKLTKEFEALAAKGQKDLAEINSIYAVYKPANSNTNWLIFGVLFVVGVLLYKRSQ